MDEKGKHPLAQWLKAPGKGKKRILQSEFAPRVGITEGHLSAILNNQRGASLELAAKIEKATNGAVRAAAMVAPGAAE